MSVNFTAQWLSPNGWVPLDGAPSSPGMSAGSAEYTWGQAGWTFNISRAGGLRLPAARGGELHWSSGRSQTIVTGTCSVGG